MHSGGGPSEDDRLAPVIPLFGGARRPNAATAEEPQRAPSSRHPAHPSRRSTSGESPRPLAADERADRFSRRDATDDAGPGIEEATEYLVRRLRTKQLSSREAREALREQGVPADDAADVIAEFEERGYLNDAALAEYLVTAGSQRKGQGRVAIGRTLQQRGIPRETADAALAELEDDDADRALEFARSKAASLARYDEDTAMRRLVGQLARRGYGGGVAMTAARTALRENTRSSGARGRVRFEDSD
ncbi:RecX family transcriptional regulator [Microbacterium resistens]|uniref:Regulatory protein RecX n=1 Tax=Microbacterium resistens TaxID=156977 RepID=A0ABY3RY23_9MICO|nr:regulatory protein RecX [Microbacterium resistens]UGS27870.1 RecX family transcriptional regulator [Microbacterium resistens]